MLEKLLNIVRSSKKLNYAFLQVCKKNFHKIDVSSQVVSKHQIIGMRN
jgi:hypothetical protein